MVFAYNISFTLLSHGRSNSCSHYSNVISGPGVCTSTIYTYTLLMYVFTSVLADCSAPCDNEAQHGHSSCGNSFQQPWRQQGAELEQPEWNGTSSSPHLVSLQKIHIKPSFDRQLDAKAVGDQQLSASRTEEEETGEVGLKDSSVAWCLRCRQLKSSHYKALCNALR